MYSNEFHSELRMLFQKSVSIHELTIRLNHHAQIFQEISMNAAIASGHCGNQSRVFTEIAKQISSISTLLNEVIQRTQEHTGFASGHMLKCIVKSAQLEKFTLAANAVQESHNLKLVKQVQNQLWNEINVFLSSVRDHVIRIHPEQERLKVISSRIWSIVMNLKVIANCGQGDDEHFFLSIIDSLSSMSQKTLQLIETLKSVLDSVTNGLEVRQEQIQGAKNATQSPI